MKEGMLEVLMYLFEESAGMEYAAFDQASMSTELMEAGFREADVHRAFHWLESLNVAPPIVAPEHIKGVRIFSLEEQALLSLESRSCLYSLERMGVLNVELRELVISQLLSLDVDDLDESHVRWVTLMAINHHCQDDLHATWLEEIVLTDPELEIMH